MNISGIIWVYNIRVLWGTPSSHSKSSREGSFHQSVAVEWEKIQFGEFWREKFSEHPYRTIHTTDILQMLWCTTKLPFSLKKIFKTWFRTIAFSVFLHSFTIKSPISKYLNDTVVYMVDYQMHRQEAEQCLKAAMLMFLTNIQRKL